MPRNGSGSYSLPAGNPVVTNTTISSTWANNTLNDLSTALTQSLAKDGQTVPTANLPMGGFKFTGLGSGTGTGDSLRYDQLFSQGNPTDIASAATVDIGSLFTNFINITGTTTITSLGTNYNGPKMIKFTGALTLTHNATTLVLPGAANITTAANDTCIAIPKSTSSGTADGWIIVAYNTSPTALQLQRYTAFTTGGTSAAFTLTPTPALTALTTNARFNITFNAAPTGSPTLAVSGLTAKSIKYYDASGTKQFVTASQTPINWNTDIIYDGTDWVVQEMLLQSATSKIQPITASVAANALTITLNPTTLDFRSSTLGSGTVNTRSVAAAISVVVSSGSTLGTVNAIASRLAVIAIDNAGTVELAVVNLAGGNQLDETNLITTVAEGGAGGADSAKVIYSTTARSSVPYRVVGFVDSTQATAGTWATAPSTIQGVGGQALTALSSIGYGQTWQNLVGSRVTGTTYYNTTGKPISLDIYGSNNATNGTFIIAVGGINHSSSTAYAATALLSLNGLIVPPGASYVLNNNVGVTTITVWGELR